MSQTIRFEELNDAAKEYLVLVRDTNGRKMPGIFVEGSSTLATWGLLGGIVLVVSTVLITLFTDIVLGSPQSVACLQAAGIVTGGWMVIAAFRTWSAKTSPNHAGHWFYADGGNFYQAKGDAITITPLDRIREAKGTQNLNDGTYTHTTVTVSVKGDSQTVTLKNQRGARDLVIFLNALAFLINEADQEVRDFPPHIHGGLARECALRGDFPADFTESDVAVGEIPAMRPDNPASSGLLAFAAIPVAAFVVWLLFSQINVGVRDDAIFDIVKSNPKPQNLRAYLLDERNQSHRAEVEGWMKTRYALVTSGIASAVNGTNEPPKDKELSEKMIAIMEQISTRSPAVSLRVREKVDPALKSYNQTGVADALWNALSQEMTVKVGPEYVAFVKLTEEFEATPAMVEVEYKVSQEGVGPTVYVVSWKVTLRTGPEDPGITRAWKQQTFVAGFLDQMRTAEPLRIRARIVGAYRNFDQPAPPPPVEF